MDVCVLSTFFQIATPTVFSVTKLAHTINVPICKNYMEQISEILLLANFSNFKLETAEII